VTSLKILVGHKRPAFSLWQGWRFLGPNPEVPEDIVLNDAPPEGRPDDSLIGEYFFLFALARQLRPAEGDTIAIGQYRRVVVNAPLGEPADNQPWTRIVGAEQAERLDMDLLTQPACGGFLISSLVRVDSVANQFALHHPLRDYFRFLADLVDEGVLDDGQIREAALLNLLVPAPSNGTFPAQVFVAIMTQLERAADAFMLRGYAPRTGYQRRILGFCLERLHSYLLLLELARRQIPFQAASGHQLTIAEAATVQPTI
jgi:hypothetical protein